MSWTLGVSWIFLWISAASNVTAYYVLSNETASWDNAKSRGNFATPTIQGDNSSWFIINITSDLNENETAWVGYYKKETAFAYIGCSLLNKTVPNGLLPTRNNSPGNCFSLCKESHHSYIGLNKGNCFCLSELPSGNIALSECDISPNGDWIAGGNDRMSLYQKIRADIHVTRGGNIGKCLVFDETNNVPYWRPCKEYDRKLCKNGSAIVSVQYNSQTYFSWKHYVKACFEKHLSPISYNDTLNSTSISQATGPTSTNVIRSDAIYRFNEKSNAISRDDSVKYGYITKRGNVTFLRFTNTSSNKRYLLQIDSETGLNLTSEQIRTTTTPTSTTKTTRKPLDNGTTPRNTSSLPIKSITTSSTPSVNDGITNSSEPMQSISVTSISESSDVSVSVSISAVAVIIVVVIVTIITLKKRKKLFIRCCKTTDQTQSRTIHQGVNELVQIGRNSSKEIALPCQISGSLYQNVDAPSREITDPHTYCALENIERGTNNMESEYSQLSLS